MPNLQTQFGRRLRRLRLARDITQERFAEQVGISVTFLGLIERGVNTPSFKTIEAIATALKVSVSELFLFEVQGIVGRSGERARASRRRSRR
jgi:transcriptional regulator with XRE-family HTH domain